MIQLIIGDKGKGKTKILLEKANNAADTANGNVVFLDKDNSHMYELKNKIRLVNTSEYFVSAPAEFAGFVAGIISADHDLEELFIDRLLKVAVCEADQINDVLAKIDKVTDQYNVKCTINISITEDQLPEAFKAAVIESL